MSRKSFMRKGVNALEMVFAMFILIVVAVVVINLFTKIVKTEQITQPLQEIKQAANYDKEIRRCTDFCERYAGGVNPCSDLSAAATFCLEKVAIDIDRNGAPGEKGHGGVVNTLPYCEDGQYCFMIKKDCACGTQLLDATNCLLILKDFFTSQALTEEQANKQIYNNIKPGTCNLDPGKWPRTIADYQKITGGLKADWWWRQAGYDKLAPAQPEEATTTTTQAPSTTISFSCTKLGEDRIRCSWQNCKDPEGVVVALSNQETFTSNEASGTVESSQLTPGEYRGVFVCGDVQRTSVPIVIG